MNTPDIASLPATLTKLVKRLRDGDWNMRTPEELAECVADAIMEALASPAGEDLPELPALPFPGLYARFVGYYTADQMRDRDRMWMRRIAADQQEINRLARLATPEQPGSSVQGEAVAWLFVRAPRDANGVPHYVTDYFADLPVGRYTLYTTPPPAPAAEQGDTDGADRARKLYEPDDYEDAFKGRNQPEARGVDGMVLAFRRHYPEGGHSGWYDATIEADLLRALQGSGQSIEFAYTATPNPVRAEQPEGKWKLVPVEATPKMMHAATVYQYGPGGPNYDHAGRWKAMLAAAPAAPGVRVDDVRAKYDELLLAVGNKYPGESRHETALRYIRAAETYMPNAAKAAALAPDGGEGE